MSTSGPPAASAAAEAPADRGLYCSTSGTYFTDKEALTAHYKSDFHRYNLKRKVAGLPPVTREWYDARAAALKASLGGGGGGGAGASAGGGRGAGGASSSSSAALVVGATRVWQDPLTKKRFTSEATYRTFVSSKKYRELVKKSGGPAPEAVVIVHTLEGGGSGNGGGNGGGGSGGGMTTRSAAKKQAGGGGAPSSSSSAAAAATGAFRVAAPNGVTFSAGNDMEVEKDEEAEAEDDGGGGESSGWETASDEEEEEEEEIEPWDPTVSLFDNRKFATVELCLEHMWKRFGFYIPDVSHCRDPSGLLSYLGAKIRSGLVPLYARGDDVSGKTFHSLHAVQRHMVDLGNCRVCWEGNEDEYAEWYEWSDDDDDDDEMEYSDDDDDAVAAGTKNNRNEEAFELALPNGKVIGARAFARFYKQSSHRPLSSRDGVDGDDDGKRGRARAPLALAGAGAAARATRGSTSLALATTDQQRAAIVARYRAMGVKEADVPAAAKKERRARKAAQRARAREQLRSSMAANINNNLPKNVPY